MGDSLLQYKLPGRLGERLITRKQLAEISEARMREFEEELLVIAERDRLQVHIDELVGRGYMIRWAPVDEPWPW